MEKNRLCVTDTILTLSLFNALLGFYILYTHPDGSRNDLFFATTGSVVIGWLWSGWRAWQELKVTETKSTLDKKVANSKPIAAISKLVSVDIAGQQEQKVTETKSTLNKKVVDSNPPSFVDIRAGQDARNNRSPISTINEHKKLKREAEFRGDVNRDDE